MKRKEKIKTGNRSTCEYCGCSIAHNIGTEDDIYCYTCKLKFDADDFDVIIWETVTGLNNTNAWAH